MTSKRTAALRYWTYDAGITHATAIAKAITDSHPNGFDDEQGTAIIADINQSEQNALVTIPKRFHEAFSAGYYVGIKTATNQYRNALSTTGLN